MKKWCTEVDDFIREQSSLTKDEDMAKALSAKYGMFYSIDSVRKRRAGLGIHKGHGRGKVTIVSKPNQSSETKENDNEVSDG